MKNDKEMLITDGALYHVDHQQLTAVAISSTKKQNICMPFICSWPYVRVTLMYMQILEFLLKMFLFDSV